MIDVDEVVVEQIIKYVTQGEGDFYNFIYLQWDALTDTYKGGYSLKNIFDCINYHSQKCDFPDEKEKRMNELKKKIKNLSKENQMDIVKSVSFLYGLVLADTQKNSLMDWSIEENAE